MLMIRATFRRLHVRQRHLHADDAGIDIDALHQLHLFDRVVLEGL